MNKQDWSKKAPYLLCFFSYTYLVSAPYYAPLKISNKTGQSFIWISINDDNPIKMGHTKHIQISFPQTIRMRVYLEEPAPTTDYEEYTFFLKNHELYKPKYGWEIHQHALVSRFVGNNKVQQEKGKEVIVPRKKGVTYDI